MKNYTYSKFMRSVMIVFFAVTLIFGSAVQVFAATKYPEPDKNVADTAGVLSESTIRSIQKTNESLKVDVGATIAICTVSTTGDEDISTYARNVFKEWKLGEGVLLLIASDDENYYFVQSVGVDDVLTNEVLEQIRDDYLEEDFSAGNIDRGVSKCVTKLTSALNAGLSSSSTDTNDKSSDEKSDDGENKEKGTTIGGIIVGFFKFILYVALIAVVLFAALFVWAMFNDDVAALMQRYIFRRGSSNQYRMPEEYYDDRLYGKRQSHGNPHRRPNQNRTVQQRRYDAYGNPIRTDSQGHRRPNPQNQNGHPVQNRQNGYGSYQTPQQNRQQVGYKQSNQGYGDETRAFTIPNRDNRR